MAAALLTPSPADPRLTSSSPASTKKPSSLSTGRHHSAAASCQSPPLLSLLPRCRSLQDLCQVHAVAVKSGLHDDLSTLTKLITFCCLQPSSASMAYAQLLFDQIPQGDHPHDPLLFNTMARGYARTRTPLRAVAIFVQMLELNVPPDDYTFPSVLRACTAGKSMAEGKQVQAMALKLGFLFNPFVLPTLINFYAECGKVDIARLLFEQGSSSSSFSSPCAVSFNAMIMACVKSSRPGEALQLFRRMQEMGVKPTEVTVLSVLSSCALLGSLELGKWVHRLAENQGFLSSIKVATAIIDMYAKCGSLEDARRMFDEMPKRDTQAWSAMIVACALHGRGDMAISLFEKMKKKREEEEEEEEEAAMPDGVTFLGLLSACSHAGLAHEGLSFFNSMKVRHGVEPEAKHYGCVVDLLARAGRLQQAYELIETLPSMATPVLWRTLLGACASHGESELGKKVFNNLLQQDDSHGGDYVIMSNICAAAGDWEEVNAVRRRMRENGAVKLQGCSSIEVGGAVNEFFAGGGKHPQAVELRRMLDEVAEQLKQVGYAPATALVLHAEMSEEEKERSLRYHSEKMAMAFGLLKTAPGTTLRIVKNLRVCRDCHSMAKLISHAFGREILLRDPNRFHHFKHGNCSCGDYW